MELIKSSDIFYLHLSHVQDHQDVLLKSISGQAKTNKLFLAAFSPMLKQCFSANLQDNDDHFTIITDFQHEDIEILSKFCNQGQLPMTTDEQVPVDTLALFKSFGIDLPQILFKKEAFNKVEIEQDSTYYQ